MKILEKQPRELDEAITDGTGVPEGEVWIATGNFRTYKVGCSNTALLAKLVGYRIPKDIHKVDIWEPQGIKKLKKRISQAEEDLYQWN